MTDDHALAGELAHRAGELLLELRARAFADGWMMWELRDQGDRQAHELLARELARHRPDDALLSEEGSDDGSRLGAERVWIVDPLDGTNDYSSPHSSDYAVHVALLEQDIPVAGAVALPARGRMFGTEASASPTRPDRAPVVIASRAQAHWGHVLADELGGQAVTAGSAGVKAMAVVEGLADVYLHPTGLYEWDVCAPAVVAQRAGLFVSGIDGSDLVFNQRRPVVPGFLVCVPDLADEVLRSLNG